MTVYDGGWLVGLLAVTYIVLKLTMSPLVGVDQQDSTKQQPNSSPAQAPAANYN